MPRPKRAKELLSPRYWLQEFWRQLRELRGKPHKISLGMAIGVFIGITPTIPFHTVLAVALAALLRGSKLAAALGVWVSNPLTIPFFYYGSYRLGRFVLGYPQLVLPADYSIISLVKMGKHVTVAMLHGGVLLGILPGLLAYFLTYKFTSSPRFQGESQ
ncbi:MAG: DUF2062 domain-containing protein [Deltaproteobacteria bacterium]|jgi:hypothetical protein|nr:DUF2062 domain-containing protein [Deltaproteobacteria bacterium]